MKPTNRYGSAHAASLKIAGLYLIIGVLWILFSDQAVAFLAHDPATLVRINIAKGWGFMVVTAILLYGLIRHQTNQILKNEELYRLLAENTVDVIWILDLNTQQFTYVSPAVERLRGYTPDEVLKQTMTEALTAESAQYIGEILPKRLAEYQAGILNSYTDQIDQPCKNGGIVYTETTTIFFTNPQNQHTEVYGVSRDISDRKQTQKALLEGESRFRTLFENSPVAIWDEDFSQVKNYIETIQQNGVTDLDAYFTEHVEALAECIRLVQVKDVNQAALLQYEVTSKSELLGGLEKTFLPEALLGFKNEILVVARGESGFHSETTLRTFKGNIRNVTINWAVAPGYEQSYSKVLVSLTDITERKQAEDAIRNSEQKFRALIENGLDYISLLDRQGNLLWESPSSSNLLGFNFNEFIGRNIFELMHPDDLEWTSQQFLELSNQPGHRTTGVFRLRRSDGSWRWVEAIASNFLDDPSVNAIVINYRDVTERKQAEIEIQQRNDDLGLLNAMNEAVIRGESLHSVIHLLSDGLMQSFSCQSTNLYMLNADGKSLALEHYLLAPEIFTQVERLIGGTIPLINIPLTEGGYFQKCLNSPHGLLVSDQQELVEWAREFIGAVAQSSIGGLGEAATSSILNSLHIKSAISVPLIAEGQIIGILDLSSSSVLTEIDLKRVSDLSRQLTTAIQRQQADERVRNSEDFLNSVQNALSAHLVILDHEGKIVRVNSAWRKFAEQNSYEHPNYGIGVNYLEVCDTATGVDAEEAQEVARTIRQVLAGARSAAQIEYPCHSPEEKRWFVVRITKFTDGNQRWVVLAHENITERKQAEEAIRRSQSILAQAGTMAHLGAWEIEVSNPENINSNPARWSDEVYRILGYEPDSVEATNELFVERVHPQDRAKVLTAMDQAVHWNKPYAVEHRIIQPNGLERIVEEHANLIYDRHGRLVQILGTVQDVTAHKQVEESLKQTSEQFRILFEASPEAIMLIDPRDNWLIIDCNEVACQMNGYTREELIGQPIDILNPSPGDDAGRLEYLEAVRVAGILRYDDLQRRKDGTIFPVETSTSIIRVGEHELVLGIDRDITERKNAEKVLRESEALYRQAIEVADGVPYRESYFNNGLSIHYDFIGDGICQITGYGPDEFNATLWDSITEEVHLIEDLEGYTVAEGIRRVRAGENPIWKCEHRIRAKDGKTHWVLEAAVELRDENGVSHGSIGMYQDITARKQVEEALRVSAEENQAIINAVPDLLFRVDQTGEIVGYHARNNNELYVGPEAFLGKSIVEVLPSNVSQLAMAAILEANATSKTVAFDYELPLHGVPKFYENRIAPLSNKEVLSIIRDITDRKQAERALQESEERYRNLVDQLPVIVYIDKQVSEVGLTQYVSPQIESILGFTPREWIEGGFELWKNQIHPEDRERVLNQYQHCMETAEPFEYEYRMLTKNGRSVWLHDQSRAMFDTEIQPLSTLGVTYDITERKQAEEDSQRRLAELEALYENGLAISKLLDPKLISDKIVEILAEKLHWHHAAIRLFHAETNQLELVSLNHPGVSESQLQEQIDRLNHLISDPNKGLTGWAVKQHLPLRSGDLLSDPRYTETYPGMKSGLYVPILAGERVLGAISVESDLANAFMEQDERLLLTLANQAAVAIENAQLYLIIQKELDERQLAEQRLRESEARQNGIIEAAMDAIITIDDTQNIVLFNAAAEKIFGCPVSEALGQPLERFVPQRFRMAHKDHIQKFGETGVTKRAMQALGEIMGLHTDGHEFPIEASISQITVTGVKLYTIILRDITERKIAEDELRQSEEKYRLLAADLERRVLERTAEVQDLYNNAPCGYHSLDANGNITRINETELQWLGYARNEILNQPFLNFLTPESRSSFKESFPDFKKQGLVKDLEFDLIRKDGSSFPILVSATAVYDKQNNYVTSRSTLFDNTERKYALETLRLANAEMKRALRTKDEFLANMSHELRTPLNAILGLSESLLEQTAGALNERQQKYLTTINESGTHLLELINDILDLAKVEAGQIKLDPNKVDINNLCQASVRMIKELAQKKSQQVEVNIEKNIGFIWADERRLKQMIVNLLSNAVKFTPVEGKLGLSAQIDYKESKLLLSIWDNGIGIREEDLPRLFKPFVQLDSSLSRETSGTGLGLALVAQMARLHGGSISVSSVPGQGSRFTIVLPWDPALTTEALEKMKVTGRFPVIKSLPGKPKTILLVEDTESVVMLVRDYLELSGYKVEVARDGVMGVSKATTSQPDLILMDVQMPGMDGLEATRRIRQEPTLRNTPIIALTALAMANDRERCLEAGMNDYVSKPVNLRQLIKTIQSYLSNVVTGDAS
jgi:PAS domain S-box-containing protein